MKVILLLILISISVSGQTGQPDSIWKPFLPLLGEWKGKGGGMPGEGDYERSYQFIFNNKFIEVKNKSVYPPSADNPKGEVHQDLGYISYDKNRKTFILRQFHIEGFVNQYKLDSISADGKRIVFTSEAIENIRAGWRARESYDVQNGSITETFELAQPQKEFEIYSKVTLQKQQQKE